MKIFFQEYLQMLPFFCRDRKNFLEYININIKCQFVDKISNLYMNSNKNV